MNREHYLSKLEYITCVLNYKELQGDTTLKPEACVLGRDIFMKRIIDYVLNHKQEYFTRDFNDFKTVPVSIFFQDHPEIDTTLYEPEPVTMTPEVSVLYVEGWIAIGFNYSPILFHWSFFRIDRTGTAHQYKLPDEFMMGKNGTIYSHHSGKELRFPFGQYPWVTAAKGHLTQAKYAIGRLNYLRRPEKDNPLTKLLRWWNLPTVRHEAERIKEILDEIHQGLSKNHEQ